MMRGTSHLERNLACSDLAANKLELKAGSSLSTPMVMEIMVFGEPPLRWDITFSLLDSDPITNTTL